MKFVTLRWPYEEVPDDVYAAGAQLLRDWCNETDALDPNQLADLEFWYRDWHSFLVERHGDMLTVNGIEAAAWFRQQDRKAMRRRGYNLMTLRGIPACLITDHARLHLMGRAAAGEEVSVAWGEKSGARDCWIVEDGRYDPLWKGSEADWRAEMCEPPTWPLCRTICRRTPRDY